MSDRMYPNSIARGSGSILDGVRERRRCGKTALRAGNSPESSTGESIATAIGVTSPI